MLSLEKLFGEDFSFNAFTLEHYIPMSIVILFGIWFISRAKSKWNDEQQVKYATYTSLIAPLMLVAWVIIKILRNEFNYLKDIPLEMCHILSFVIPFMLYTKHKRIFGVFYFWVMGASLQSLITPALDQGFPHFVYIRYWIMHGGIVIFILYAIIIYGLYPKWKDFFTAVICAQVFFFSVHGINLLIGSNYVYTRHKPESASLLDYLGEWPWYIFNGECLMFVLFFIAFIPFLLLKKYR